MKKRYIVGIIMLMALSATGCQKSKAQNLENEENIIESEESDNMTASLMTKEYLLEKCGIAEKDLEGVDAEEFINKYELIEGDEVAWNIPELLEIYKEKINKQDAPYEYLWTGEYDEKNIDEEKIKDIQTVALYITNGTYQETFIFDNRKQKGYWGKAVNLMLAWDNNCMQVDYDEKKESELKNILEQCQIYSWKKEYKGTSEGTTGDFGWSLYLELENGIIYQYAGEGVEGENSPEQWGEFNRKVKKMFEE